MSVIQLWNTVPLGPSARTKKLSRLVAVEPGRKMIIGPNQLLTVFSERSGCRYRPVAVIEEAGRAYEFRLPRGHWVEFPNCGLFVAARAVEIGVSGYPEAIHLTFVAVGQGAKFAL